MKSYFSRPLDSFLRSIFGSVLGLTLSLMIGCGVKGKPLPPLTAPPIGRGKPTLAQPQEEIEKSGKRSPREKNPGSAQ